MTERVISEDVLEKAHRLLTEGNLDVYSRGHVDSKDVIHASCVGESGETYRVDSVNGRASCSCRATGLCSHMLALALVTGNPPQPEGGTE